MRGADLSCATRLRGRRLREAQAEGAQLIGLDYLEVGDSQRTLTVYFIGHAPEELSEKSFLIEGGRRITNIRVERLDWADEGDDDSVVLTVDRWGDFSTYTLRLVVDRESAPTRPDAVIPRYDALDFSFKIGCPSDLDCAARPPCPPAVRAEPSIDYLAKDYASFNKLLVDRLSLILPAWRERVPADLGVTLVELMAYVGDYLSYYQDAVATEAYLETARQRVSVRRHARLVDYVMSEGCNARAWLTVSTDADLEIAADAVAFVTAFPGAPSAGAPLTWDDLRGVSASEYEVFEPVASAPGEVLRLFRDHSEIRLYTWGDEQCCLPRGATSATLVDGWVCEPPRPRSGPKHPRAHQHAEPPPQQQRAVQEDACTPEPPPEELTCERTLHLKVGDVLILEEIMGPKTGLKADADPTRRQAVRLTRVELTEDPLTTVKVQGTDHRRPQPLVEIEWSAADALAFPLCLSSLGPAPACELLEPVSVARGNVILVDNGRTVRDEDLGEVPIASTSPLCRGRDFPGEIERVAGKYRPRLEGIPLTFRASLPEGLGAPAFLSARVMLEQDPREALPQVWLRSKRRPFPYDNAKPDRKLLCCRRCGTAVPDEHKPCTACVACGAAIEPLEWTVRPDLLSSGPEDANFVVEMDNRGVAWVRFGDGDLGRAVEPGMDFSATYRVGNGPQGNVGAESITLAVLRDKRSGASLLPRNPLPAEGGALRERMEEVKLFAPGAIRARLERAVIADDYARIVETHAAAPGDARRPRVQRAAATLAWTGSYYEVQVAIDQLGSSDADPAMLREVERLLYRYRRIGHDIRVAGAQYVPLAIELEVCVEPARLRADVKAAVQDVLSARVLPGGELGFFYPDSRSTAWRPSSRCSSSGPSRGRTASSRAA
jgi:hypothetical protein